ncbi:MAG: hypothetical protein ACT4P2_00090 [Pseudomonadota bacterium]
MRKVRLISASAPAQAERIAELQTCLADLTRRLAEAERWCLEAQEALEAAGT